MSWIMGWGPGAAGIALVVGFGLILVGSKAGQKAEQTSPPSVWGQAPPQRPLEPPFEDRELRDRVGRLEADVGRLKDATWRLEQSEKRL